MKLESKYDAVVIGGGPSGSEFARVAAKAGMQVLVLEKKKELGSPVRCGEGITSNWEKKLGLPFTPQSIGGKILGVAVYAPNGHKLVLQTSQSTGYVLERKIFDKQLAINAVHAGAHYSPRTIATQIVKKNGKIAGVKASREGEDFEVGCDLLVCAEGMESLIARQAGFAALSKLSEVDTCYEYEMANVPHEELIEVYFGNKIAPRGYVWVFPKGKGVANVGIGVGGATGSDPKALLDDFIAKNPRFKKAEPVEIKGGIISVGAPQKELVKDNAMIIGTSAHQVDPVHGGGIGLAIEAGYLAGTTAAQAFEKHDYSRSSLAPYEEKWWGVQGPKLEKRLKIRFLLEKLSDDDFNAVLGAMDSESLDKILEGKFAEVIKQAGRFGKLFLTRPHLIGMFKNLI
ncbi:MAG: NAD(P)/FAD-dependent oxidoreductase [Candidatus Micrarchaeia archaeon]|jgi:digeranylgeranylglycerophospholipid reductase